MPLEKWDTTYGEGSKKRKKTLILSKKIMKKVLNFEKMYSKITVEVPQSATKWNEVVEVVENLVEKWLKVKSFPQFKMLKLVEGGAEPCCQVNIVII